MRAIATSSWSMLQEAAKDWVEDKASQQGAALAFYSVLSLAPLVVIALWVAGLFAGLLDQDEGTVGRQFMTQMRSLVGQEGSEAIATMISSAGKKPAIGSIAALFGLVTLLFGASGVFGQLQASMNTIWDAKPKAGNGLWSVIRHRFLSFAMVLGTGFLLLISLLLSAAVATIGNYFGSRFPGAEALVHLANEAVTFIVVTLLFAMMFKLLPDKQVAWRDVFVGALITALLFTVGKLVIGLYIGKSAIGSSYGAAGSLVVLLVWIYYSAQVLFFGAELAHTYAERRSAARRNAARAGERPVHSRGAMPSA